MTLPAELADLVARQSGVATRKQLLDGGVTVGQLRWAMGRRWRIVLPRVVLLEPGLPSVDQRLVAALLFAGPDAWLARDDSGGDPWDARMRGGSTSPGPRAAPSDTSVRRMGPGGAQLSAGRTDRHARPAQSLVPSPGRRGRGGRLSRPGCRSRAHHRCCPAAAGPSRRHCALGRSPQQPWPSTPAASPRRGGHRGLVGPGGRSPEDGQRQQPAAAAVGQPHAPRPARPTSHDARPLVRRRRPGGDGPLPRLPQRRARLGGHRRG